MNAEPDDDVDALMARLCDGDRSAFSLVFKRLWAPTHRLCMGLLKNEADASDAAQQAMEKILERASDYDPKRPAMPWALAIASWECRTILRKRSRRRETSEVTEASTDAGVHDPETDLVQRELTEAAVAAMGQLSDNDRQALLATFWEEAASVDGAALRKRRERALTRLRNSWRRLYGLD